MNYQATFAVPGAATTGIEILLTVGAQISGTWQIGNMQFEKGSIATSFDYRDYGSELIKCYRHCYKFSGLSLGVTLNNGGGYAAIVKYPATMFSIPTLASGATLVTGTGAGLVYASTTSTGINWTSGANERTTGIDWDLVS